MHGPTSSLTKHMDLDAFTLCDRFSQGEMALQGRFILTVDTPHLPLRGTFSLAEKVAEGRMRGQLPPPAADNETALDALR